MGDDDGPNHCCKQTQTLQIVITRVNMYGSLTYDLVFCVCKLAQVCVCMKIFCKPKGY
jgi:hypothetical protein